MTIDIEKLKALALAASPGPWKGDRYDGTVKYTLLDANDEPVIRGDNGNSDSGPFGIDKEEDEAYLLGCNPATVLELIAEVERLQADAERLDFMIADECHIERMDRIGAAPLYRVRWPWTEEQQTEWSASSREAIDTAIAAKEQP